MEKKFELCATKKRNILTLLLSENSFLNETKNHKPHLQVKWSVPYYFNLYPSVMLDSLSGSLTSISFHANTSIYNCLM